MRLRPTLTDAVREPDAYVKRETAAAPRDDEDALPDASDAEAGDERPAGRAAEDVQPVDGDFAVAPEAISTEPASQIDGPIEQPGEVTDVSQDTRAPEDIAVFEEPRAGYDPRLFQVEDIDPTTDRRPAQFARLEPYDPVGFRIGSFVLFPELTLTQTLSDNVTASRRPESDSFQTIKTETRLVSNWTQHALELRGTTTSSYYDNYESENQRAYLGEVRGRVDLGARTNVQVIASTGVAQEKRTGIDANTTGDAADIRTDQLSAALSHRFNRLTLRFKTSVMDQEVGEADGVSNASRNYVETTQGLRGSYEVTPRVAVFAEATAVERDHVTTDFNRDTPGERYRAGLDFGSTSKALRGEVSAGYGTQRARDGRLQDRSAFLFDTNLAWRVNGLTSFLFTAVSDIADTTSGNVTGVISRQLGVEARHAFRNYLVASAGLMVTSYDYGSSGGNETGVTASLGGEYTLNPEIMFTARVEHTNFDGNTADRTYDESNLRFGVRLRQ